jgi:uncharacterized membrane protein
MKFAENSNCYVFTIKHFPEFVSLDIPIHIHYNVVKEQMKQLTLMLRKSFNVEIQDLLMMILVLASITLSEIASRAFSPVNDPGTAIQIINSHVRPLFDKVQKTRKPNEIIYSKIVPQVSNY